MLIEEVKRVKEISAETKNAMIRKSAQTLPNNPSAQGYSAEEIKRRFYQSIIDIKNSAISEIGRVINEVNVIIGQLDNNMNNFLDNSLIAEPFTLVLDDSSWQYNEADQLYEVFVTKEQHKIEKREEIGVDMFLLDANGNYVSVNQFEILPDLSIRFFHEHNTAGNLTIYIKREGYVVGDTTVKVGNVIGISKVGISNNYEDLDNIPNLNTMNENERMISKIISGEQEVNKSINSEKSDRATYSISSGMAKEADSSKTATKATEDQFGVNIAQGYCKQNGSYPDLRSGKSTMADNAKADEDGVNIKINYTKQNGNYPSMTVGNSGHSDKADRADVAGKAEQDGNGANIANTYATKTGNYQSMTVGKATNSDESVKSRYISFTTTPPTQSPPEGYLVIYYGKSIPATKYDRVLYLIGY